MQNIVLLSDGTGNGAAKKNRTNVWRLYRALDLHRDDQIAFYDDGVGSQEFLPLKILGGVIGWGLKRNVKELYKFLCRNYKSDDGDKIFLFGFSRGAFTVRVLAGMIDHCGLYTAYKDENDLQDITDKNYTAFRSKFRHGVLSRAFRAVLGMKPDATGTVFPEIEFVGVWDTVDAYGLPIDALAILWDKFIFPIRFPDQQLSVKVVRACHALAIDDERVTFHPVLWDESVEKKPAKDKADRIEQVWFAGVHSDVGGGYPMNDLSLVPLDWMISKVEAATENGPGLHFIKQIRKEFLHHSDWHGMQHDSRSGLGAYYRYQPREIERFYRAFESKLPNKDADNGEGARKVIPKIHRGVLERIHRNAVPYAPTGLPADYKVVATGNAASPVYEDQAEAKARALAMIPARQVIRRRMGLYVVLMLTTLALLVAPFLLPAGLEAGACEGVSDVLACPMNLIIPFLKITIGTLPDFTAPWFEAWERHPGGLWGFIFAFIMLLYLKKKMWNATQSKAMAAWTALKRK